MSAPVIQNIQVVVSCPSCGAEDYDIEFDGAEIAACAQVSIPCDECPSRILVDVDVRVQAGRAG